MVDDKQIKQWLKDGTINQKQADKMLADSSRDNTEKKSVKFIGVIATIGSILIAIGFAWLIAKNWHQIPDPLKVLILVVATLAAFTSGVLMRTTNHEGIGRSLLVLGALLYILSLFLISQTYNLATTLQHYTWLVFLAWTMIMLTAYLLDSKENLVLSMWLFFPWLIMQYYLSFMDKAEMGFVMAFVILFISVGALLYGLSIIHKSLKHRFANVYQYWTVFYFLLIVFLLSFQMIIPYFVMGFEAAAMTPFVIILSIICIAVFAVSVFFGVKNQVISSKDILIVSCIIIAIFLLTLLPQITKGTSGTCSVKSCYSYLDEQSCESSLTQLYCEWGSAANINIDGDICMQKSCYIYKNESSCTVEEGCIWQNNYCSLKSTEIGNMCRQFDNEKQNCESENACQWNQSYSDMSGRLTPGQYFLWILNNILLVGFIIFIIWYGQQIGEKKIVNLAISFFVIDIISRYIGFWMDFSGYLGFSLLSILGGLILILGAWLIPKWRRKLLDDTKEKP
jgi:uncharacterized membrane protein